jgi:hypothetical protein
VVALAGGACLLGVAAIAFVALAGAGTQLGACAPPRPGYVAPGPSLVGIARLIGPALLVFLVGMFFALAPERRWLRVLASSIVASVTFIVFELSYLAMAQPCGGFWS